MADFTHDETLQQLKKSQEADFDQREQVRESDLFLNKSDGQWEPEIINRMRGRPRYTDDRVNPIVDQISGEITRNEFTLRVSPAGGQASKEVAQVYDGLIRNIRNISDAEHTFNTAAEIMVGTGLAGWEVVQDWASGDTFDQDLLIKPVQNFEDRVWYDSNAKEQDMSDALWVIILDNLTKDVYDEMFPDGSGLSVSVDQSNHAYYRKPETITIGRLMWKKPEKRELVEMIDGSVYLVDEKYESVKDELARAGITEKRRRTRDTWRVYSRLFDGGDWLKEEEETVFDQLPVVPVFGNYRISEGKVVYRGVAERLKDLQRVHNYAFSRDIEEGALNPRGKFWMTKEQAGDQQIQDSLKTMNVNSDPVQFYVHKPDTPVPFYQGGPQGNPGLQVTMQNTERGMNASAGMFAANMGDNPGLQSGVAIGKQIDRGNNGTIKYFAAVEKAICYTAKVIVSAIPRVYDSTRQIRIVGEDGTSEMVTINQVVFDEQQQRNVELNDLTVGNYDVVCDMGEAFKSKQEESAQMFADIAQVYPPLMDLASDVWFSNINAPGFDKVAERARQLQISSGVIPEEQLTDEEREQIALEQQQAAQNQQPDPAMLLAQAEILKGQAEQQNAQNKAQELQLDAAKIQLEAQSRADKLNSETQLNQAKVIQTQQTIDQNQQKIDLDAQDQQFNQMMEQMKAIAEAQKAAVQEINTQAQSLKTLREAMGVDAIVGPTNQQAYIDQADEVLNSQDRTE